MTREDADMLQAYLDEYARGLPTPALSDKRREGALFMYKTRLAAAVEPLIPKMRVPGVDMDLSSLFGIALEAFVPTAFDKAMKVAVVDGHEKDLPQDGADVDEYMKKYGIEIPGDIVKEAMQLRTTQELFALAERAALPHKEGASDV